MMVWYGPHGPGMWWGIVMTLLMLAFWGGVAALIVSAVRGGPGTSGGSPGPEQILAERFARGEIDADEYRTRMRLLSTG